MKNALVCPLDWGIGHAARCVPVIYKLVDNGFNVIIAADSRPYEFLRREFPGLTFLRFKGVKITYPRRSSFSLKMFLIFPAFLAGIWREHQYLKRIVRKEQIDLILSDNRYGLWHKEVHSILITHQLKIILPDNIGFLAGIVRNITQKLVSRFDECWIPDFEMHGGLAGKLSHPPALPRNHIYLGALSRFSFVPDHDPGGNELLCDFVVTLSGPEPQRTIFEEKIFHQLRKSGLRGIVVRGIPETVGSFNLTPEIKVWSHLESKQMLKVIRAADILICRSGYSSIMDVVTLGKKAIFVPTPGQTEQEYLARYMMEKKIFFSMPQEEFDLTYALEMSKNFPGLQMQNDYSLLNDRIRSLAVMDDRGERK